MEKTLCEYDKMMICFIYFFFGIASSCVYGEDVYYGGTDFLIILGRLIGMIIFLKMLMGLGSRAADSFRNFVSNRADGSSSAESRRAMREQEKEKRRQQREYAKQVGKISEETTLKMMLLGLKAFERFVTFCNDAAEWVKYYASKAKAKIQEFRAKRAERKAEKAQRKKDIQAQKFDIRKMG